MAAVRDRDRAGTPGHLNIEASMRDWIERIARRLTLLSRIGEHDRGMDEEMRFHLEMEAAALEREGVPPEEARKRARRSFGPVTRFKEEGRDARGTRLVEDLWRDVTYALRQLRGSPGFAAATILTLALGIGVMSTRISAMGLGRTLEGSNLPDQDRLVVLGEGPLGCERCLTLSAGSFEAIRDQLRSIDRLTLIQEWEPVLRGTEVTELTDGVRVLPNFFETLRIQPMLGRTLVPADGAADRQHVVVLHEGFWRERFAADPAVVGKVMTLDLVDHAIVGVVAAAAAYPQTDADFWAPLVLTSAPSNQAGDLDYTALGRMRTGASLESLDAGIAAIAARGDLATAERPQGWNLQATSLAEVNRPTLERDTLAFTAAVGLVYLIACVNLAGLLTARLSARRRELSVRRAIGAGAGRIARQLFTEAILLTSLGAAAGAGVAMIAARFVGRGTDAPTQTSAFLIPIGLGLVSGLLIGLWPAIRFARQKLGNELREATSHTATGGADSARFRRALVVAQVAVTIVLVAATGLLARSFQETLDIDPGFETDRLIALRIQHPPSTEPGSPDAAPHDGLVRALENVGGVERAGASLALPFGVASSARDGEFEIEGSVLPGPDRPEALMQAVTPGYFEALGVSVVQGRAFAEGDGREGPAVAMVNEAFVDRYLGGEAATGRMLTIDERNWEIVGVVGNVFYGSTDEVTNPEVYRPMQQVEASTVWVAVRAQVESPALAGDLAEEVHRFDPDLAVTRLLTMNTLRTATMDSESRMLRLMGFFALAALLISGIGLYGLISYSVAQRTREFGVRLALGAERRRVLGLVLRQGLGLAAIGGAIGLVGAIGALRVMRSLIYGISPVDPMALTGAAVVILALALFAAYLPAHRAMRVDPITTLRGD
jgi:putative ABC transport system permease protein